MTLSLVGNAPSSGSTLLADLLDSTLLTACGPELEFFCNKRLYNFREFQKAPDKTSNVVTLRATGIFPRYDRLSAYRLNRSGLKRMIRNASSLKNFFDTFALYSACIEQMCAFRLLFTD